MVTPAERTARIRQLRSQIADHKESALALDAELSILETEALAGSVAEVLQVCERHGITIETLRDELARLILDG
jgi:hypothetical protein